jgi:2-keto-4-pentenoate hydratase/2-oxohepta-3-ene-1,7-dioic acid hydratase in catechol pathway
MVQYARLGRPAEEAGQPEGHDQYAIRPGSDDAWVELATLGLQAADIGELVAASPEACARLSAGRGAAADPAAVLRCPVVRPSKMIAIGLNYMDHIRETGAAVPDSPISFAKYPNSLNDPFGGIVADPSLTAELDYEAELAVIIGRPARGVSEADALGYVFGYACANDVSARDLQRADPQLSRSKSLDTCCPIGPWITTASEVPDPQALAIGSWVNGEARQQSSTAEMIFGVAELIAFLSAAMTLSPGDVILTGTPHGVGMARAPAGFLQPGDEVTVQVGSLGAIRNRVVRPAGRAGPS